MNACDILLRYGYVAEAEQVLATVSPDVCQFEQRAYVDCYLGEVRLGQGNVGGARQALEDPSHEAYDDSHIRLRLVMLARIAVAEGDTATARRTLDKAEDVEIVREFADFDGSATQVRRVTFFAQAELAVAEGNVDEARSILTRGYAETPGYVKSLAKRTSIAAEVAAEVVAGQAARDSAAAAPRA